MSLLSSGCLFRVTDTRTSCSGVRGFTPQYVIPLSCLWTHPYFCLVSSSWRNINGLIPCAEFVRNCPASLWENKMSMIIWCTCLFQAWQYSKFFFVMLLLIGFWSYPLTRISSRGITLKWKLILVFAEVSESQWHNRSSVTKWFIIGVVSSWYIVKIRSVTSVKFLTY
jgi:hypothetical protein